MRRILGGMLLLMGAVFIAAGMKLGQDRSVFLKAIMICLECIGLG